MSGSTSIPLTPTLNGKTPELTDLAQNKPAAISENMKNAEETVKKIYKNHQDYREKCIEHLKEVLGLENYKNFIKLFDKPFSTRLLGHRHVLISYVLIFFVSFLFVGIAIFALKDIFLSTAEMIVMFSLLSAVISFPKLITWIFPKEYKHLLEDLKYLVLEQDEAEDMKKVIEEFKNNPDYNYEQKFENFKKEINQEIDKINQNTDQKLAFKNIKNICKTYNLSDRIKEETKTEKTKKTTEIVLAVASCLPFFLLFLEPKDEDKVREGVGNFFAILGPALFYILVNKIFNGASNIENTLDVSADQYTKTKKELITLQKKLDVTQEELNQKQNTSNETIENLEEKIQDLELKIKNLDQQLNQINQKKYNKMVYMVEPNQNSKKKQNLDQKLRPNQIKS